MPPCPCRPPPRHRRRRRRHVDARTDPRGADVNADVNPRVNPDAGDLTVTIHDRHTDLEATDPSRPGRRTYAIPIGPLSLVDDVFERRDPPTTAALTNALGIVHDHLDDVVIEAPAVAATASIVVRRSSRPLARPGRDRIDRPARRVPARSCGDRRGVPHDRRRVTGRTSAQPGPRRRPSSTRSSPRAASCSRSCDDWRCMTPSSMTPFSPTPHPTRTRR